MKYLDPKSDLTFKKVFGEHPDLAISLLNALLPFLKEETITDVEYLAPEREPEDSSCKDSCMDIRCSDSRGRKYIVEIQMVWSPKFRQHVPFDLLNAYVRQVQPGKAYEPLRPVCTLYLINEIIEPQMKQYYHYYRLANMSDTEKVIDDLQLVLVELPKVTPHIHTEKEMQGLWLRYFTEINEQTSEVPAELLAHPEIRKAVEQLRESAYTPEQLLEYEKAWEL